MNYVILWGTLCGCSRSWWGIVSVVYNLWLTSSNIVNCQYHLTIIVKNIKGKFRISHISEILWNSDFHELQLLFRVWRVNFFLVTHSFYFLSMFWSFLMRRKNLNILKIRVTMGNLVSAFFELQSQKNAWRSRLR